MKDSEKRKKGYDSKLRTAMGEIENVIKKHDIAGFFGLFSKTHVEFKFEPMATWSLIEMGPRNEDHSVNVKIKMRPKLQEEMDATGALVFNMRDLAALFLMNAQELCEKIKERAVVTHTPFDGLNNDDRIS